MGRHYCTQCLLLALTFYGIYYHFICALNAFKGKSKDIKVLLKDKAKLFLNKCLLWSRYLASAFWPCFSLQCIYHMLKFKKYRSHTSTSTCTNLYFYSNLTLIVMSINLACSKLWFLFIKTFLLKLIFPPISLGDANSICNSLLL